MRKSIFPIWWLVLAAVLIAGYAIFGVHITIGSWDVLTGEDVSESAVWEMALWAYFLAGGAIGLVAVLVFTHSFVVMHPLFQKSLYECRPPPPPPYVKPARHN